MAVGVGIDSCVVIDIRSPEEQFRQQVIDALLCIEAKADANRAQITKILAMTSADFFVDVRQGKIPGTNLFNIDGENPDFAAGGAIETVWGFGGLYSFPAAAATLAIQSSDANDTLAGTGAQKVRVVGLDANYVGISETVDMNGLTTVNTVATFLRVNTFFVVQAGSGGTNAGAITALNGADTVANMAIGDSRAIQAVFTVPAGRNAIVLDERWGVDDLGLVEGVFLVGDETGLFTRSDIVRFGASGEPYPSTPTGYMFNVREKNDIEGVAQVATKAGNPTNVTVTVAFGVLTFPA